VSDRVPREAQSMRTDSATMFCWEHRHDQCQIPATCECICHRYYRLRKILLGEEEPWPLRDVLRRLSEFADRKLRNGYDGHGHEELSMCVQRAALILAALDEEVRNAKG
jgi:hypothetical protein